jgi:16S rRNA (guanine1207-N2)-methyltransferase
MIEPGKTAVYGEPPRALADVDAAAVQFSPLIPGGEALERCTDGMLSVAWVYAPAGTLERRYVLAQILRALAVGAPLTVLAPKDKGGQRLADELAAFGCMVHTASRSHHRICTTRRPEGLTGVDAAISAGGPQHHATLDLWTQPGVFSWDRLDAGTVRLLQHLPPLTGAGADLGAGLGVLSRAVLQAPAVTALTLVDIDHRAVDAARRNITDPRAQFAWADLRHTVLPATGLDFVVMNPPFHDTGVEDQTVGQMFIARAAAMLRPWGVCWMVANRHLPYEAALRQHFKTVTLVNEAGGYKIYKAEK